MAFEKVLVKITTSKLRFVICKLCLSLNLVAVASLASSKPVNSQVVQNPNVNRQDIDINPRNIEPSPNKPFEEPQAPQQLPPPEDLLPKPRLSEPEFTLPGDTSRQITVKQFVITGSTAFKQKDFDKIITPYLNRPLTIAELFKVRSEITNLYISKGYITSGAFIPPQKFKDGVVEIKVIEGKLEDIKVRGNQKLKRSYIRSRLARSTKKPLNREKLLKALQLLQINPLIENISAKLSAGTRPGESLLEIEIRETNTFQTSLILDNARSPSVGTFRRQIQVGDTNLLGYGDSISGSYKNTDGSNSFDFHYKLPINPRNGTISLNYGISENKVIEEPFNILDIQSDSRYYEVSFRQPIVEKTQQELGLGITLSRRESEARFLDDEVPFQASGADAEGKTKVSAIRFFQDWTSRDRKQVFALRSQFSIGVDWLNSTINETSPDSNFYAWRGQMQWVRLLAKDTLLLLRGDMQFADRPLVPFEQFGLGGQESIRGYRQDALLKDNGIFASAEVRIPIFRFSRNRSLLQVAPFIDFGTAWNRSGRESTSSNSDPNTLVSAGLGLRLQLEDRLSARFDWGIPLVSVSGDKDSLQENGLYFSIIANPF
ncbi:ShlB/FhaC/HecB family hemolysin secretion/activation protein [Mastigocoleus testarum]|uniref:Hemolysin activation/secretion protein n=1 Tax=Mastigocoleus testarum BC008 TaxID=371196 RepID=A0A0V7ZYH5_9CYAN|nr:ShlB/FhaC/HecB family hemolysin secretion/activation protein [Mastigocoleus testarum]KST69495.1 hemolysin activation/secretion protein [Mastigocoleus testarum BC008]KST69539.1 hemolysin activation/secretion protein [Mastigocoleus testarum BC008]